MRNLKLAGYIILGLVSLLVAFVIQGYDSFSRNFTNHLIESSSEKSVAYQQAAILRPYDRGVIYQLAELYHSSGNTTKAARLLDRFSDAESKLRISELYFETGDYELSMRYSQLALTNKETSQALIVLGKAQLELNEVGESCHSFQQASSLDLSNSDPKVYLALCQLENNNADIAKITAASITAQKPLQAVLAANTSPALRARELAARGLVRRAYDLNMKLDMLDAADRELLASICLKWGRYDEAIRHLEDGIKLDPASIGLRQKLADTYRKVNRKIDASTQDEMIKRLKDGRV